MKSCFFLRPEAAAIAELRSAGADECVRPYARTDGRGRLSLGGLDGAEPRHHTSTSN